MGRGPGTAVGGIGMFTKLYVALKFSISPIVTSRVVLNVSLERVGDGYIYIPLVMVDKLRLAVRSAALKVLSTL
jgi:hypothetical protein